MLIALIALVVLSTVTATTITWLLLTGRATPQTRIPLGRRRSPRPRRHNATTARRLTSGNRRASNLGQPTIDLSGGMSIGLGNGLTLDTRDGSLGMRLAPGISLDFDGK